MIPHHTVYRQHKLGLVDYKNQKHEIEECGKVRNTSSKDVLCSWDERVGYVWIWSKYILWNPQRIFKKYHIEKELRNYVKEQELDYIQPGIMEEAEIESLPPSFPCISQRSTVTLVSYKINKNITYQINKTQSVDNLMNFHTVRIGICNIWCFTLKFTL